MSNNNINLPAHISFARELRKNQTPEEKMVWDKVRGRRLLGFKFLRQHPIIVNTFNGTTAFYIADFYCAEKKLVVEIDGLIHALQIDYDKARDIVMNEMGLQIIRINNEEINANIYEALAKIKAILK
jgi:leucyl-tRNA synthetase